MLDMDDLLVAGVQIWIWEKYLNLNLTLSGATYNWLKNNNAQKVCYPSKIFTVDLQSNILIKQHYCAIENATVNMVNLI